MTDTLRLIALLTLLLRCGALLQQKAWICASRQMSTASLCRGLAISCLILQEAVAGENVEHGLVLCGYPLVAMCAISRMRSRQHEVQLPTAPYAHTSRNCLLANCSTPADLPTSSYSRD